MATFTPETIATVAGLLLTTLGAAVAARAVIVTEQQATELASPKCGLEPQIEG